METRRLLLALGGLTLARLALGQAPPSSNGLIPYRKLTWRDFPLRDDQDNVPQQARADSRILWKYRAKWTEEKRGWFVAEVSEITIETYFDPKRSWRKTNLGPDPDRLLAHEQVHLDLTYLQMLRLRQVPLEQFGAGTGESSGAAMADLDDKVKKYFEAAIEENRRVQDRYDVETQHGRNQPVQVSWERKLAKAIQDYSTPTR
ncbi:MAG: hypothetical protein QM758_08890 [Armatimonas sp.]